MPSVDRRERFLRSLSPSEMAIYQQMAMHYAGKALEAGRPMQHDQCELCAARFITNWREHGLMKARTMKIGQVPADWPDIEEKPIKDKVKRQRKAPPGQSEAEIQSDIIKYLVKRWVVIRFNSGAFMQGDRYVRAYTIANSNKSSGVSDVICFRNGKHLFLEVKSATGSLSDDQKAFRDLAAGFGETVHVVRSVADVQHIEQQYRRVS
jgi:hypothetical protein